MADDDFAFSLATLRFLAAPGNLALWVPPLALGALVRVITHRWVHQLVFPACTHASRICASRSNTSKLIPSVADFLAIPLVFYLVVLAGRFDLSELRRSGWLFDVGTSEVWWKFYAYFGWTPFVLSSDHTANSIIGA
jgi:SulP family sulfate permease